MSTKEDFSRQLEGALSNKQRSIRLAHELEKAQKIQSATSREEQERERAITAQREEDQKNKAVLELDAKLPIKQYLEALRDQVAPLARVGRWGPKYGTIAHAFFYGGFGFEEQKYIGGKLISFSGKDGSGSYYEREWTKTVFERKVFGVKLEEGGPLVKVYWGVVQIRPLNQLVLNPFSSLSCRWDCHDPERRVDIAKQNGLQQFAQALTEFYVQLKTGQGKY